MSIVNVTDMPEKNTEKFVPDMYKGKTYRKLAPGDKVTIVSCAFSVYYPRNKTTGQPIVINTGAFQKNVLNCTVYFGLSDGTYTSLRNRKVQYQMTMLTGFVNNGVGVTYYDLSTKPETVTVIQVQDTYGKGENQKTLPVLAFQQ